MHIIHRTGSSWQRHPRKDAKTVSYQANQSTWQQYLQQAITDPRQLLDQLAIDTQEWSKADWDGIEAACQSFALRVPLPFVERMQKGNLKDPLLQQVLPVGLEQNSPAGYSADPVGEQQGPQQGLIHKYQGRVLLIVNGHCAVNCRYCFRRHFPYDDNRLNRSQWQHALAHIAADDSIEEVIYSGGDPMASSDNQLQWLTEAIADIPHIKRLRIHTRLPIMIPNRINEQSISWMTHHRLQTIVVLHINHANEIDQDVVNAIQQMKQAGITLLNQTVLLADINDNSDTLTQLSETLFNAGVLPYYLHLLDKVTGSAHFDTELTHAKQLYRQLQDQLPGYMVPKLVREIAGETSKTLIPL